MTTRVERLAAWIERQAGWALLGLSALYVFGTITFARRKLFWFDEVSTLEIARLPFARVFSALHAGADHQTIFFHLVTRASVWLAGDGLLGLRLPAVAGFLAMSLGLFVFVRRRLGTMSGFVAFLLPFLTGLERYTAEARAYGLMLAFCGIALVAWQAAASQSRNRTLSLSVLAVAALCATAAHSYAVFFIAALAAGEAVRFRETWKPDWALWAALALALMPPIWSEAKLAAANAMLGEQPYFAMMWHFYERTFAPLAPALAAAAVLAAWASRMETRAKPLAWMPAHELAASVALLLGPPCMVILSIPRHYYFDDRYGSTALLGAAILAAFFHARTPWISVRVGFLLIVAALFCRIELYHVKQYFAIPSASSLIPAVPEALHQTGMPVYMQDPWLYTELRQQWPAEAAARLRYVSEPAMAQHYTSMSMMDSMLRDMDGWGVAAPENYAAFVQHRPREFLLYFTSSFHSVSGGWLLYKLLDEHAHVEIMERHGDHFLYRVTLASP